MLKCKPFEGDWYGNCEALACDSFWIKVELAQGSWAFIKDPYATLILRKI